MQQKLNKDNRHHHFWIEDGELFETYQTIRGLRFRFIMPVPGMSDTVNCTDAEIKTIEDKYLTTLENT
jgi:hypothetical protein